MGKKFKVELTERELCAVLAALRMAQEDMIVFKNMVHWAASMRPMNESEIDRLCEKINCGG